MCKNDNTIEDLKNEIFEKINMAINLSYEQGLEDGKNKKISIIYSSRKHHYHNIFDLSNEYGIGYTIKGEPFYFDLDDYDKVKEYYWRSDSNGYLKSRNKDRDVYLHRHLMKEDLQENLVVDHINGNPKDNRKENLRVTTQGQNSYNHKKRNNNTSGVTGVCFNKNKMKWQATIKYNKKQIFLGYFKEFDDAVKTRKEAEEKYFKEYRRI